MRRGLVVAMLVAGSGCFPPQWGANAILHPRRTRVTSEPALDHTTLDLPGDGITLRAWLFRTPRPRGRPLIVYLHGSADNRGSGAGVAGRFVPRGYDVLAFDGRAHGDS